MIIKSSGVESNRIVYGAFGNGIKPIISLKQEVPGWTKATWTNIGSNIWYMSIKLNYVLLRLWINDKEVVLAKSTNGDNLDGTVGVCSTHKFYYDKTNYKLYIYSTSNPTLAYSSLKSPGLGFNQNYM